MLDLDHPVCICQLFQSYNSCLFVSFLEGRARMAWTDAGLPKALPE